MYIVNLLRHLTELGFIEWKQDGEKRYKALVGTHELTVSTEERPTLVGLVHKTTKNADHHVLKIKIGDQTEELVDLPFIDASVGVFGLLCWAQISAKKERSSEIQKGLAAEMSNVFGIRI